MVSERKISIVADFQLLCLPFAGGNETSYLKFEPFLSPEIEMVNFQLPGKSSRIGEAPLQNIYAIIKEIGTQAKAKINKPYAIYGHSMGALLGHLLCHYLIDQNVAPPKHFFLSSYFAPSHHHDKRRKDISDAEFITRLKRLNGLPPALVQNPKLLDIFLPVLRADINAIDGYRYMEEEPYDIPMSIFFGSEESGLMNESKDWRLETTSKTKFYTLKGNHFFIFQETEKLCELIRRELLV